MNPEEKKLTIQLLEKKIERISGKKIVYLEAKKVLSEAEFNKKKKIAKTIKEMVDSGISHEEITEVLGLFKKAGEIMGTRWTQQQAEQTYNQSYAKYVPAYATKVGATPEEIKKGLIDFMMKAGGSAVLSGNGQNAEWDPTSKSFKQLSSKLGGPQSNVMGEEKK